MRAYLTLNIKDSLTTLESSSHTLQLSLINRRFAHGCGGLIEAVEQIVVVENGGEREKREVIIRTIVGVGVGVGVVNVVVMAMAMAMAMAML